MINPFATATEIKVLGLLDKNVGLYGLELVRQSGGQLKRGTIYVVLGRLEERGLVKSWVKKGETHPGIPRPLYSITVAGERMLKAWQQINAGGTGQP